MDSLTSTIIAARRVILSVGSGDGSQQTAIVRSGHKHVVSTFFDSEQLVYEKYPSARENLLYLKTNSRVMFGIDATKLHEHAQLKDKKFDIIIFTFPHTGIPNNVIGISGFNPESIESYKTLIRNFLKSSQLILADNGEIIITLKTSAPYDKWDFPDFAQFEIEPKSQHDFNAHLFPGYVHSATNGHVITIANGNAKSFVFSRRTSDEDTANDDLSFKVTLKFLAVNDQDIETYTTEVLSKSSTGINVLDIRRLIPESIRPDTRQLNRVLYHMESSNIVKKGPPNGSNKKPTWLLQYPRVT